VKLPNAAAKLPPAAFDNKSRAIGGQLEPLVRLPPIETTHRSPTTLTGMIQRAPPNLQETKKRGGAP
jgi:hypothetical protein